MTICELCGNHTYNDEYKGKNRLLEPCSDPICIQDRFKLLIGLQAIRKSIYVGVAETRPAQVHSHLSKMRKRCVVCSKEYFTHSGVSKYCDYNCRYKSRSADIRRYLQKSKYLKNNKNNKNKE